MQVSSKWSLGRSLNRNSKWRNKYVVRTSCFDNGLPYDRPMYKVTGTHEWIFVYVIHFFDMWTFNSCRRNEVFKQIQQIQLALGIKALWINRKKKNYFWSNITINTDSAKYVKIVTSGIYMKRQKFIAWLHKTWLFNAVYWHELSEYHWPVSALSWIFPAIWFPVLELLLLKAECSFAVRKGNYVRIFSPLNTKRRLLYLKTQFVPRSEHSSSRL